MRIINIIFGIPLGYLMYFSYWLLGSYGLAIILFTLLSKIITMPLSLLVQKNSIKLVKIQPMLDDISRRYAGDKDKIAEEQIELYKREHYSAAMGLLPTLIQIPIILGLINVIYNPMQHLLHLGGETIAAFTAKASEILGTAMVGSGTQLQVVKLVQSSPEAFEALRAALPGYDSAVAAMQGLSMNFLGWDLSAVPSLLRPDALLWVPVLSALTALVMCVVQNRINVLQREQGALNKWGVTAITVGISAYFPFLVPAGVGLYWAAGNLLAILVLVVCNWIYDPRKHIDYANRPQKKQLSRAERDEQRRRKKDNRARERADSKRFYAEENEGKQLVFYSESNGFYKYLRGYIDYVTNHSDIMVHYVTSDPGDQIFQSENRQITPYYIGDKALIPFMMKMDADMVVMTMPDLGNFQIKRSLLRKDIEYVYTDHAMISLNMGYREGALDHFDTMFCVGPHQVRELREMERVYRLPERTLVETGYCLFDDLLASYAQSEKTENAKKKILIAPSWQPDNIMESCLDPLLSGLLGRGHQVVLRPHPEFIKRFGGKMQLVLDKYGPQTGEDFIIETDFSSNVTIFTADLVITDWSGIAQEFSYATQKPALFINTPMKVLNPNYKRIRETPLELKLRDEIGVSLDMDKLDSVADVVAKLFAQQAEYAEKITRVVEQNVFNIGRSAEVGGRYIINALEAKPRSQSHP